MKDYREIFDDSYSRLTCDRDEYLDFLTRFYENFVAASSAAAEHFSGTDMVRQRRMLARSLTEVIDFSRTGVASEYLRQVARRHSRDQRDVRPDLYAQWLESLIATAREFQPDLGEEAELAWRVVLAPGIAYMQYRYDHF
jgi:hypothetical protein